MGIIYRRAESVIAWLGNDKDVETTAFGMIERISHAHIESRHDPVTGEITFDFDGHDQPRFWHALIKLFESPCWRRTWIIQELAVGSSVHLLCSLNSIPFAYLAKIITIA